VARALYRERRRFTNLIVILSPAAVVPAPLSAYTYPFGQSGGPIGLFEGDLLHLGGGGGFTGFFKPHPFHPAI
jgi:hypothetical protein